jgi:hypothetical protein
MAMSASTAQRLASLHFGSSLVCPKPFDIFCFPPCHALVVFGHLGWLDEFSEPVRYSSVGLVSDANFSLARLLARHWHFKCIYGGAASACRKKTLTKGAQQNIDRPRQSRGRRESVSEGINPPLPLSVAAGIPIETRIPRSGVRYRSRCLPLHGNECQHDTTTCIVAFWLQPRLPKTL